MIYVLTQHGYYFRVTDKVNLDQSRLIDAQIFDTEQELLEAACEKNSLQMDEVAGGVYEIDITARAGLSYMDDMANVVAIETSVEAFLNDYVQ